MMLRDLIGAFVVGTVFCVIMGLMCAGIEVGLNKLKERKERLQSM